MEDALVLVIAISCGAFVVLLSAAIVRVLKLDTSRRPLWREEQATMDRQNVRDFERRLSSEWRSDARRIK